ncbi:MAG: dTDP-glucose 4,6-dehydratase [Parcubacteria group bacterium Gr01-1014_70]|nr:MAG: dTDP-glucose 4,6-dehydratase [Parcubacteria group bacterium Gr01-1014_70]
MKIFVTGVTGFIGSHFGRMALLAGHSVVGFARQSDTRNIRRIDDYRSSGAFRLVFGDITGDISGLLEGMDAVVHFAARTFVDHSILDPEPFIQSNIVGTYKLLEQARKYKPSVYVQVSTDEVYGTILEGAYKENACLNPTNPYSSTKAAADMLCLSYWNTYKLPIIITRTENNYGPWQHPQKAIPVFVRNALQNKPLPVYGDGKHRRMWLHVEDHCSAILHLLRQGKAGEIYHVAGEEELENEELARRILTILGKPHSLISFVPDHNIRPGHDRRYALNVEKLGSTGWKPSHTLADGLEQTVLWYKNHPEWCI